MTKEQHRIRKLFARGEAERLRGGRRALSRETQELLERADGHYHACLQEAREHARDRRKDVTIHGYGTQERRSVAAVVPAVAAQLRKEGFGVRYRHLDTRTIFTLSW